MDRSILVAPSDRERDARHDEHRDEGYDERDDRHWPAASERDAEQEQRAEPDACTSRGGRHSPRNDHRLGQKSSSAPPRAI